MILPGRLAKEARLGFADIIKRYCAGDASLMGEIEANAKSDSPIPRLARAAMSYGSDEEVREAKRTRFLEADTIRVNNLSTEVGSVSSIVGMMKSADPDWNSDAGRRANVLEWLDNIVIAQISKKPTEDAMQAPVELLSVHAAPVRADGPAIASCMEVVAAPADVPAIPALVEVSVAPADAPVIASFVAAPFAESPHAAEMSKKAHPNQARDTAICDFMKKMFAEEFKEQTGHYLTFGDIYDVFAKSKGVVTEKEDRQFRFYCKALFLAQWPAAVSCVYQKRRCYRNVAVKAN